MDASGLAVTLAAVGTRVLTIEAGASVTLKNLKIINGDTNVENPEEAGGGINSLGELTLVGCEISGCRSHSGGGIFGYTASARLRVVRSKFLRNEAAGGGAIEWRGPVEIYDSEFESNNAMYGGAVSGSSVVAEYTRFVGNGISFGFEGGAVLAVDVDAHGCFFEGITRTLAARLHPGM